MNDTICALSTPPINAALALIRVSGSQSKEIAEKIFSNKKNIIHRMASYGFLMDEDKIIDDIILIYFESPNSFTGEDMVEISCHGNQLVVQRILKLFARYGVRQAEPGEFSKRAFLNGKMDLIEAESINHLITARSDWEIDTALKQMHGSLRRTIDKLRDKLILLKANIESVIDFIEEDIEFVSYDEALDLVDEIKQDTEGILQRCKVGERLTHGIDVDIIGTQNVGKSSLLNMILNKERAIVSNIPGTTRDMIRESVQIAGIHINLIDTAGIDKPRDEIEEIGIGLSHKSIDTAAVIIMVIDSKRGLEQADREILDKIEDKKVIYLLNKCDLSTDETRRAIEHEIGEPGIDFSAKKGIGFPKFEENLASIVYQNFVEVDSSFIADIRVVDLLEKTITGFDMCSKQIEVGEQPEIVAYEIQSVIDIIGEITGQISPDAVLDSVFSRFCIGK